MKQIFYHVVTNKPMYVGQEIVFDSNHHSGVYNRVYELEPLVNDIYKNPEKYKSQEFDHHLKVALRELAMEEVRLKDYPDYPSRLSSLYVSRTLEESLKWYDIFINLGRDVYQIVKVEVDGNYYVGDSRNCFDGTANKEENLKLAQNYWKYESNQKGEEPIVEIIADGKITVVDIEKTNEERLSSVATIKDNIIFEVDYRTELLSIILILSDDYKKLVNNKMIPLNNKYIYDNVLKKFSKFKNHKTIELFNKIINKHPYFNYDAPITMFLQLDEEFKCAKLNDYIYKEILEEDNLIYEFISSLSGFAKDINFKEYYYSNKSLYSTFVDAMMLKHNSIFSFLRHFMNIEDKTFYVNAIPFNSYSNYSSFIGNNIYANIGVTQLSKAPNLYEDWELNDNDMMLVTLHEFCHSVVNPLTKQYINIKDFEFLKSEYKEELGYTDVETIINETAVRTICLVYEYLNLDYDKFKKDYDKEVGKFKYITDLFNIVLDYYNENVCDFSNFYLKLIDYLKSKDGESAEYLDEVDDNNELTGKKYEREFMHENNIGHRHVSAWIMNNNGEILLQRRAYSKKRNPGKWAKTGGHVDAGETPEEAIKREIFEEIGLNVPEPNIKIIDVFKSKNSKDKYFTYNFLFITDKTECEFILQTEEVAEVKYFKIEDIEKSKKDNDPEFVFTKWDDESFYNEMDNLKAERKKILETDRS